MGSNPIGVIGDIMKKKINKPKTSIYSKIFQISFDILLLAIGVSILSLVNIVIHKIVRDM
jgi:hypothetical protein